MADRTRTLIDIDDFEQVDMRDSSGIFRPVVDYDDRS
jgi:hypothetical protein